MRVYYLTTRLVGYSAICRTLCFINSDGLSHFVFCVINIMVENSFRSDDYFVLLKYRVSWVETHFFVLIRKADTFINTSIWLKGIENGARLKIIAHKYLLAHFAYVKYRCNQIFQLSNQIGAFLFVPGFGIFVFKSDVHSSNFYF